MEVTHSLLVSMMFIVLLTIGIGNIVMALAVMLDKRSALKFDVIYTSWMVLLLLIFYRFFWQVLDLLSIGSFSFWGFLYIITGPLLLLFASNVMMQDATSASVSDPRRHYHDVAPQFFLFLALVEAWVIGFDVLFMGGLTVMSGLNIAAVLLFSIMASSRREKVHSVGTVIAWLLLLAAVTLEGTN